MDLNKVLNKGVDLMQRLKDKIDAETGEKEKARQRKVNRLIGKARRQRRW